MWMTNLGSVQFSSAAQSCPTLCDSMNCSTPGIPVRHHLPEFTQTRPSSRWCHPAISSSVIPFSSCPQSLPGSESFPVSQLFASLPLVPQKWEDLFDKSGTLVPPCVQTTQLQCKSIAKSVFISFLPIAAVTNFHKFRGFKATQIYHFIIL